MSKSKSPMSRQLPAFIFLGVVLIFIVGAVVLYFNKPEPKTDTDTDQTTPTESIKVLKYGNNLNKIAFKIEDTAYEFSKSGTKWKIVKPEGISYNDEKITGLAISLADLSADKLIGNNVKDLAEYGLDKPLTFDIESSKGKKATVQLGKQSPTKTGYYLKLKDENKVYLVSSTVGDSMNLNKVSLKNRDVFPTKAEDYTGLALYNGDKLVYKLNSKGSKIWRIDQPITLDANDDEVNKIIDALARTKVAEFEDTNDLAKFGLDSPVHTLEWSTKDGNGKLLFGVEKVSGSTIYAKLDGKDEVFTLNIFDLNFLEKPIDDITSKLIAIPSYSEVGTMEVTIDGKSHKTKIEADKKDKEKDKFIVDDVDLKKNKKEDGDTLFREYYQAVIGIRYEKIDMEAVPEGEPDINVVYTLNKDPGKIEVSLVKKDDDSYYILKDGKYTGTTVSKKFIDESLVDQTTKLEKFMDKIK